MDACPYGAIYYNEDLNLAQKCTGCAHLLDRGWKEPRCVDVCPTQALELVEIDPGNAILLGDELGELVLLQVTELGDLMPEASAVSKR